jgi:UDP-N-acetylglucosamine 2-epimerase (non-hydrolysing)
MKFFIVHTNQHYSKQMDEVFFRELELPLPKYNLHVGSGLHGTQVGKMLMQIEEILIHERPRIVLVQGDTNSVLAGALAAKKLNIPVGHIEAGLRSYSDTMPEETNRVITDHISSYLFCPTIHSRDILLREGIERKKIVVTGNTIVDILKIGKLRKIEKLKGTQRVLLDPKPFCLLTLHRQENVDNPTTLASILQSISISSEKHRLRTIFPVHPRTEKMIRSQKILVPKEIECIEPVGYAEFQELEKKARMIATDSGGVQEEACILHIPCITLRDNTERPETIFAGANMIAGTTKKGIAKAMDEMLRKSSTWKNPFGNGTAAQKIVNYIVKTM